MRIQKSSPFANQLIENLIKAAELCDPVAINEFFLLAIHANIEHLNLISETLTLEEEIRRTKILTQGSLFLSLFNHFATRQIRDGLGLSEVHID